MLYDEEYSNDRSMVAYHIASILKLIDPASREKVNTGHSGLGYDSRPDKEVLREGIVDTPQRVAKAYSTWFGGYRANISDILKTSFQDGGENYNQMVVRQGIPLYSHCEHHLAPIFGEVTVAYIPGDGKGVVGLSKLDRLVDAFGRRLQVQERLTNQIADAIVEHLEPKGVAVFVKARHMCVESRGVMNQNSNTVTSALRGVFLSEPETRAEFMALARS